MHGTSMDATTWFTPEIFGISLDEGEDPLPIRLLKKGCDVWLGNMRGTQYSRKHTTLNSSDPTSDYWNFSWAEKGMLDVPAAIDKIKEETGESKVAYIGASQGTTIMFYALTKQTEEEYFADNMSSFIALDPCLV